MYFFSPLAGLPGRFFVATAAVALALALTGCATVPPPNDSMTLAQNLLQGARDAGAADYAPVDLGFAQDKFQLAQAAMAERNYALATDLAQESTADAELASAKARLGAARTQIQAKLKENTRLRSQGEQLVAEQKQVETSAAPAAATSVAPLPVGEMPAPAASVLSAPAAGELQAIPDDGSQPAPSASFQGGQS